MLGAYDKTFLDSNNDKHIYRFYYGMRKISFALIVCMAAASFTTGCGQKDAAAKEETEASKLIVDVVKPVVGDVKSEGESELLSTRMRLLYFQNCRVK